MNKYISELDTNRFGFPIARVDVYPVETELFFSELRKDGVKMIISKIDLSNLPLINLLEKSGFEIKDVQVTYTFDYKTDFIKRYPPPTADCSIRFAEEADQQRLVEIAEESFVAYGHYFADNRLDPKKCGEIYTDWIYRSVYDKNVADVIFVAEIENEIAGFLSLKLYKDQHFYGAGVQGAVAVKYRNLSIFRSINQYCIDWGNKTGLEWLENNVIINNLPVNYCYSNIGYRITRTFATLHGWINE
jgi:hypothetical protein